MLEQEKIFLRKQQQNKFLKMLGGKKNAGGNLKGHDRAIDNIWIGTVN